MDEEKVDDIICDILRNYGPDGHVDGHEKITDFIMSLLDDSDEERKKPVNSSQYVYCVKPHDLRVACKEYVDCASG